MVINLLIIDDDAAHSQLIAEALALDKYRVAMEKDAESGLKAVATNTPDLLLLDWKLPDRDGPQVLEILRRKPDTAQLPVIMLTSMKATKNKVEGLDTGADDYLTKPCELPELRARVRAVLRRRLPWLVQAAPLESGELTLDPAAMIASVNGKNIALTKIEFEMLYLFVANAGRIVQRRYIESRVMDVDLPTGSRTLDVHLSNIREKLGPKTAKRLETSRGLGYIFS